MLQSEEDEDESEDDEKKERDSSADFTWPPEFGYDPRPLSVDEEDVELFHRLDN